MTSRFPEVTWFCDHCGECLSYQDNFDDNNETWPCNVCGHENRISEDHIVNLGFSTV
ncbi:MAG: hypothetical protein UHD09_02780 [Bifidobacterium sp.]|nr:hypothetical protein [Bifidobacterium sp.]